MAGARRTPPRPKTVEASYVVTKRDLSLTLTPKPQSLCGGQIRTTTQPQRTALSKRRGRTRTRIRAHTKRRSLVIPNVNAMRTQRTWRPPRPLRRSPAGASWAVAAAAAAREERERAQAQEKSRPIHPSWEAKKKLKEKEAAAMVPSQGKKLVFT